MRIGIVTLYDYYNYGSYLQAFAMKIFLESQGHKVYFIRTQSVRRRIKRGFIKNKNINEYICTGVKICKFQKDLFKLKQVAVIKSKKLDLDHILIGSDELWNTGNDTFNQYPYYYGKGYDGIKKTVFAMSIGNGDNETLKKYPYIKEGIKLIDHLSARDEVTREAIKQISGKSVELVCDPTFLVDKALLSRANSKLLPKTKRFILVYSYSFPEFVIPHIKRFADENLLEIISVCFNHGFANKNINCSPLEFSYLVSKAEYVVTTTFHGSIFSVLNHKKMAVVPFSQKVTDLLVKHNLGEQIISSDDDYNDFCKRLNRDIDYKQVDDIIEENRQNSIRFLVDCLEN